MSAVAEKEATEIVAPRDRTAVALRYDKSQDSAPVIVATGRGYTADKIVETARKHGVPLRSDAGLASALAGLDLGAQIPGEMYRAVAEVLVWVYNLEAGGKHR
jgi:flagellar biosynthesis protein